MVSWKMYQNGEQELHHLTGHRHLRHTHASQLLLIGAHPKVVSERLGHSSISITLDIYSHLLSGIDEEATNKIDEVLSSTLSFKN
jgi:integrase